MPSSIRSLAFLTALTAVPACFGPTCTSTTEPAPAPATDTCPGSAPSCRCFDFALSAECEGTEWVCPPGWGTDGFDPACAGGSTTSTTAPTGCWNEPDGECEPGLGETCDCADCDGSALCNPFQCVDDGACTILDACTCADCANDAQCSGPDNCNFDGACDGFYEGCACDDCTSIPSCAGSGGGGGAAGGSGGGGAGGAAAGGGGSGGAGGA